MPAAIPFLPLDPPEPWVKPTSENTKGGKTYKPTHPDLFRVEFSAINSGAKGEEEGETYSSQLIAAQDFPPNTIITHLSNLSEAPAKAYSSVQFGPGPHDHFELNSDLLLMNHSCSPSVYLDLKKGRPDQWCIRTTPAGLSAGQAITFFYPSTEWDMAQGFKCSCGSDRCLGEVRGAKYLTIEELESRSFVNEHIRALKEEQGSPGNGHLDAGR